MNKQFDKQRFMARFMLAAAIVGMYFLITRCGTPV